MEIKLIDLKHAIGKIEQTSYSNVNKKILNKDGMTFTILSPSMIEEHYGFEPAQSIQLYGAENIQNMAKEILAFCEAHFEAWEEQEKNK